ncbi:MAG: hypothetical protein U1C18_01650, partial [Patescibacteria group bacterium]|nr:hypothetical protein [Patescibacteria group bacterium]
MDPKLEKSILATIAYFDVFEYPLTLTELSRLLLGAGPRPRLGPEDIWRALEKSPLLAKAIRLK